MALSYSLELATPLSVNEVAQKLNEVGQSLRLLGPTIATAALVGDGVETAYGTLVYVTPMTPLPWGTPQIGEHTFLPTIMVSFDLGKEGDIIGQQDDMTRFAVELLAQIPGDAVLHYESEAVWLVRLNGELSLSEHGDIWPPNRLSGISGPYRRKNYEYSVQD
ncbi:SitI3 family protein [Kitasatospora sp. NPDC096140]|uniref:SitI3 family protein n=1 Tax=Kitasatospora sp. NPDC096140 TaxID=3155425 RepID=UPI0033230FB2